MSLPFQTPNVGSCQSLMTQGMRRPREGSRAQPIRLEEFIRVHGQLMCSQLNRPPQQQLQWHRPELVMLVHAQLVFAREFGEVIRWMQMHPPW